MMARALRGALLSIVLGSAAAAAETSLTLVSEPGDSVGLGIALSYTPADGTFSAVRNRLGGVSVSFTGSGHEWHLDFARDGGAPLFPRVYRRATRFTLQDWREPGLSIVGDGRGCDSLLGTFEIKQVAYGSGDEILAFWARFEQHCAQSMSALMGEIRFEVDVPISISSPMVQSVEADKTLTFQVTAKEAGGGLAHLSATGLPAGEEFVDHGDNTGSFSWRPPFSHVRLSGIQLPPQASFHDNGDNTGTFSWTPDLDSMGTHFVNFFGSNSDCDTDTATTRVEVEFCAGVELSGRWTGLRHSCTSGDLRRPQARCSLRGTLQVSNLHLRISSQSTWVNLFLSDDDTLGPDDIFLRRTRVKPLPAWSETTVALGAQLPPGLSAEGKYVIAVIDATNVENECDEAGNVLGRGPVPGNHPGVHQEKSLRR